MQRACVAQITRRSDDAASVAGTETCDRWKRSRRYMRGKRNQKTNATKNENGPESVLNISYDWQLRGDKYQATQPSSGGAKAPAGQVIKLRILHAAPVFNAFLVRRHLGCCGRIQPPARPRASRQARRYCKTRGVARGSKQRWQFYLAGFCLSISNQALSLGRCSGGYWPHCLVSPGFRS